MGELAAVGVHVGLVAVHVVDVRRDIHGRGHLLERCRCQQIVVVQKGDELAGSEGECVVRRGDDAAVGRAMRKSNSRVLGCGRFEHGADPRLRRSVVDDAPLPVGQRLRSNAVDACL